VVEVIHWISLTLFLVLGIGIIAIALLTGLAETTRKDT